MDHLTTQAHEQSSVTPASEDADLYAATACVTALVGCNVPSDTIELLLYGSKSRDIAPGALTKAIKATIIAYKSFQQRGA
jgi:hypothetical protein